GFIFTNTLYLKEGIGLKGINNLLSAVWTTVIVGRFFVVGIQAQKEICRKGFRVVVDTIYTISKLYV
ncbi:MAG: hypothetical protein JJ936_15435, partial [Psychroserpens sp.]|nr:hypothetical protein [Psychroserpens sp.]